MTTENAPVPFDAAALRAGVRPGETWAFALTDADGVTSTRHTEVVSADESGGVFAFWADEQAAGATQTEVAPAPRTEVAFTWDDLVGHATYPLANTTISETTETVLAGTFEGWLYTVRQPDGAVVEAFFARALAGPPVRWERLEDGEVVSSMVLLYRR